MAVAKTKRVLLKLSGEALAGGGKKGIDDAFLNSLAKEITGLSKKGYEFGIVLGGGNFWRGRQNKEMDQPTADNIGMLATVMNGLALQAALLNLNQDCVLMSAFQVSKICELIDARKARNLLKQKKVVIFVGGTGNPFFTTDSGAALRALEIEAEELLLAKNIDAVYDSDPKTNKNAKKYSKISYNDVLEKDLKVMDGSAIALCRDNKLKIHVFGLTNKNAITTALINKNSGTIIS